MELTVKAAGALASTMVGGAVLLFVFMRLMGSKPEPVIALELAETSEQVRNILDQDGRDVREGIRKATYVDFIFLAAY